MTDPYRIIGSEESPFSVKIRSYFRFKGLPHEWIERRDAQELFSQHAKLPLIPLLIKPDGTSMQDSTPIIEAMEREAPEPSVYHPDPALNFIAALIEEFGDEWGNKWMFHLRWHRTIDQVAVSKRFAETQGADDIEAVASQIRERMVPRVWFVGSNEVTGPQIEKSFRDTLALLDTHLGEHDFVMGGHPTFADFGLWGQIYNAGRDPTGGAILEQHPAVARWVTTMLDPPSDTSKVLASWPELEPTLLPLLADQIADMFLPWSVANAHAIEDGQETFDVMLKDHRWTQKPQKYHARSLAALRGKFAAVADNTDLNEILVACGADEALR